jgi:hypothetical protein
MNFQANSAKEGLLLSAERWAPADSELWGRWRESLTAEQRAEALMPLQAVLSGLVAFRHLDNHPPSAPLTDFRPHLHAVRIGYGWALELIARLGAEGALEASLRALERSLSDALRVSERLLELQLVDAGVFQSGCDLFLRDLEHNSFFQPPEPLEFSNVTELVPPEGLTPELDSWKSDRAKMATLISFLALLRDHRFLGIADRQIREYDGVYRAHIVVAAVRRELRTLTRFLLVQGVETFAEELEAKLLSVEALALGIHAKSRSALDDPVPEIDAERGHALVAERMRNGIRELRATVKDAAKQLRIIGRPVPDERLEREERKSERVQKNLHQDIWAFRFIVQAFVAKASLAPLDRDDRSNPGSLEFASEFLRHFRVLGLPLSRGTGYERRAPLTQAVSALSDPDAVDASKLALATDECVLFLEHLDDALAEIPQSLFAPFDKNKAAAELRGYLSAAKDLSR